MSLFPCICYLCIQVHVWYVGMNISFISHPFLYLVILNDNKHEIKNGSNRNKVSFISGISIDFQWVFCFVFGFPRENFKLCVRVLMLTCFFSFLIPIITKHWNANKKLILSHCYKHWNEKNKNKKSFQPYIPRSFLHKNWNYQIH